MAHILTNAALELACFESAVGTLVHIPAWRRKLTLALKGADLPQEDTRSSARDVQFELLTAAEFAHAGFDVHPAEPDIVFRAFGRRVGIAAKRVSSADKVMARARDACTQIRSSGLLGIVAIDVTRVLFKSMDDKLLLARPGGASSMLRARIRSYFEPLLPKLFYHSRCSSVIGFVLTAQVPSIIIDGTGYAPAVNRQILQSPWNVLDNRRLFKRISAELEKRSPSFC